MSRITEIQKRSLECWLQEWNIEQELRRADVPCDERPAGNGTALHGTPREGAVVEVRQIRLLYPDCSASWHRPVYLALLDHRQDGGILAAPFSRFSYPALPGELIIEREDVQLRVISLWCAQEFRVSRLALGWQVDDLDEGELRMARSVYEWIHGGEDVPGEIKERVGPPLIHPLDPRWDYREEELEFLEALRPDAEPDVEKLKYSIKELPIEYRSKAADSPDQSDDDR